MLFFGIHLQNHIGAQFSLAVVMTSSANNKNIKTTCSVKIHRDIKVHFDRFLDLGCLNSLCLRTLAFLYCNLLYPIFATSTFKYFTRVTWFFFPVTSFIRTSSSLITFYLWQKMLHATSFLPGVSVQDLPREQHSRLSPKRTQSSTVRWRGKRFLLPRVTGHCLAGNRHSTYHVSAGFIWQVGQSPHCNSASVGTSFLK